MSLSAVDSEHKLIFSSFTKSTTCCLHDNQNKLFHNTNYTLFEDQKNACVIFFCSRHFVFAMNLHLILFVYIQVDRQVARQRYVSDLTLIFFFTLYTTFETNISIYRHTYIITSQGVLCMICVLHRMIVNISLLEY